MKYNGKEVVSVKPFVLDIDNVNLEDEETLKNYREGKLNDTFTFSSAGMIHTLKGLKVDKFSDLVLVNAMFRPGAMDYIGDAIAVKNGEKQPRYWFGQEELLKETYGIIAYQEQGMEIAKFMGFTGGETDNMRKALAKKNKGFLDMIFPTFKEKAIKKGFAEKEVDEYWDSLIGFSRYSFNKCLSGDTKLMRKGLHKNGFNPTLKEMYRIQHDEEYARRTNHLDLYKKYKSGNLGNVQSIYADNRCRPNKLIHVEESGVQQLYELELEDGRKIKCTGNHTFPTLHNGICELLDLTEQDYIFTYGEYDKKTNLFKTPHEDYCKNLPKSGEWGFKNSGKQDVNFETLKDECKFLRINCNNCGKSYSEDERFELHHIDGNHSNDDKRNLKWLCNSCHKKAHYQLGRVKIGEKGSLALPVKVKKITKLNKEVVYSVKVDDPAHNFAVENGIITGNSHAYAYAVVGYQTGYLKTHYPVEYYAAYLNHVSGDKEKLGEAIKNAKKMGLTITQPDVLESETGFTADSKGRIVYGLSAIKGFGKVGEVIIENRKNRRIETLRDFFDVFATLVPRKKLEILAEAGAFDNLCKKDKLFEGSEGRERAVLLYNFDLIYNTYNPKKKKKTKKTPGQVSMFDDTQFLEKVELQLNIPKHDDVIILEGQEELWYRYCRKILLQESELLGNFVSENPLDYFSGEDDLQWQQKLDAEEDKLDELRKLAKTPYELGKIKNKLTFKRKGIITKVRTIKTKTGKKMCFCSVNSGVETYDMVVFPTQYEIFKDKIKPMTVFVGDVHINRDYDKNQTEEDEKHYSFILEDGSFYDF